MIKHNEVKNFVKKCEAELSEQFARLDEIALFNQEKVLNAFRKNDIQARHMCGTAGYGYDDIGRDALNKVYADVFNAESALVSPMIASGTHALTLMLFGVLRPGDLLLSVSGAPYDTMTDVILGNNIGSLKDFGVAYKCVELLENVEKNGSKTPVFDFETIKETLLNTKVKAVFAARSRGYSDRSAISVEQIAQLVEFVKKYSAETLVLTDNCYGEFVEKIEPTEVGADLVAGSLIKNIGGGIAPTGGYIAGKSEFVKQVSYRLTAPSIGNEVGSYISGYQSYFQGLFLAPSTVKNALKGALLFAKCYGKLGYETLPVADGLLPPYDIICSLKLNNPDDLVTFCRAIQEISPIDSNVCPEPWEMPGYNDLVIMAAGTFVQGASIELSADSPIKPPYIAYIQGALTYEHAYLAVIHTLNKLA